MTRGLVIVVGPDGAGKTVLLDEVERRLGGCFARAHSRPGLIAGRAGDGAPVVDPHVGKPRGKLASLAKLAVVFADTVLGSWLRWRPRSRVQLLAVERGWYDLAVDPQRYRLPGSFSGLITALGRFVPRADLTVLMAGDPAELDRRKPEIGHGEVARQLAAWEVLAPRAGRRVLRLDTVAMPVEVCASQVLGALQSGGRRWYRVPVAPRRLDLRATGCSPALGIYRPHAPRAQRLCAANAPLLRARLAIMTAPPPIPHLPELLERIGAPVRDVAAFRSSVPGRWVVGAADHERLHTVLKIGPAHDRGLATEQAALEGLSSAPGLALPRLLWTDSTDGWHAIAMDALTTDGGEPSIKAVAGVCTRLVRGDLGRPLVHGDLAPWNLGSNADGLAVWDLEHAQLDVAAPLHDLCHYVVRTAALLGRWTPEAAAALLTARGSPGAGHLADLGIAHNRAAALVRGYLQATAPADDIERRLRHRLGAALPA